ncbi:hypothetical protein [Lujinxingia vulgaris]|uniref:hypothetical protein n=1 Tax=Lujinxingia vulgaris TaxID=2600176 RepID=UPI001E2B5271|nr:hypothetical protein [Lujinxingia vulgaris]
MASAVLRGEPSGVSAQKSRPASACCVWHYEMARFRTGMADFAAELRRQMAEHTTWD